MAERGQGVVPLRLSFKVPRAELDRARDDVEGLAPGEPVPADFDRTHLRGEVTIVVDAPFASDPVLDHLGRTGKVSTKGPVTVSLAQPVAYVVGQLAGALVLAMHGEGDFTIPLAGGKGALSVGCEGTTCHFGVPLEAYAGVAAVPAGDAARAVSAACRELAGLLRRHPWGGKWRVTSFLERERAILEGEMPALREERPIEELMGWRPDDPGHGPLGSLEQRAGFAEARGAHVVPYWKATQGAVEGEVRFEPLRSPGRPERAGALALCIFPEGERLLEAALPDDAPGAVRLRNRLKRRAPFAARFGGGKLAGFVEASNELPMA